MQCMLKEGCSIGLPQVAGYPSHYFLPGSTLPSILLPEVRSSLNCKSLASMKGHKTLSFSSMQSKHQPSSRWYRGQALQPGFKGLLLIEQRQQRAGALRQLLPSRVHIAEGDLVWWTSHLRACLNVLGCVKLTMLGLPARWGQNLDIVSCSRRPVASTAAVLCHRLLFPPAGQPVTRSQQLQGGPDIRHAWPPTCSRSGITSATPTSALARSRLAATGRSGGHRDSASLASRTDGQQWSTIAQVAVAALMAREADQYARAMTWPTSIQQLLPSLTWT